MENKGGGAPVALRNGPGGNEWEKQSLYIEQLDRCDVFCYTKYGDEAGTSSGAWHHVVE